MGVDTGATKSLLKVKRNRGINELMAAHGVFTRGLKSVIKEEHYELVAPEKPTFVSIEVGPSDKRQKKYCDITGFPAKYTDPKTKLRFCSKEAFAIIRSLPVHKVEELLAMRGAQTKLK